jgi:hypothetical protein
MDNVQKNSVTDCNTPSSEPFRLHLVGLLALPCLAVCPHVTARQPLKGFSWNLIFGNFTTFIDTLQVWLKSDSNNNGNFTRSPTCCWLWNTQAGVPSWGIHWRAKDVVEYPGNPAWWRHYLARHPTLLGVTGSWQLWRHWCYFQR